MPDMNPAIDLPTFTELQDNTGADFVVELVDTFVDESPGMLAELRAAWAAGSADRFRRAAHSMKTNALSFGALRLGEAARALERGGLPTDPAPIDALESCWQEAAAALKALARG
jgi:HPt (histidine-containing phosphotransfer) domain-containing protein